VLGAFLACGLFLGGADRPALFLLAQRGQRHRARALARPLLHQFHPARQRGIGIVGGIGQDHDRRLQAFRSVHGHHPHQIGRLPRLALQFAVAAVEPWRKPTRLGTCPVA
jgi:hypothetical protein